MILRALLIIVIKIVVGGILLLPPHSDPPQGQMHARKEGWRVTPEALYA